ncbi:CHAT domain-containing protein [Mycena rosella]|uniref:CHAT domain-containing protein n=1 Tax=Mycena rosella TaxID=1033263 RepID=A0AAD7FI73_MYCRO|nr:CHAT domain-containing protein [Mycena rosella]
MVIIHSDLPVDMQMSVQLVVENHIIQQTVPADAEPSQDEWKPRQGFNIPEHILTFTLAVVGYDKARCTTRLLGYVEATRDQIFQPKENRIDLINVNPDGPILLVHFSVSESLPTVPYNTVDLLGNKNPPMNSHWPTIFAYLHQIHLDAEAGIHRELNELCVLHETILFLPAAESQRARLLNILGDSCLNRWWTSSTMDFLNQSVVAYEDAVRDDPITVGYLRDLAAALFYRFEQLGDTCDINRAVLKQENAVQLTPDGPNTQANLLSTLGMFLLARFERLDDPNDLNRSISNQETAVNLAPDSHSDKHLILSNAGNSLQRRFVRLGDLKDLDKCISYQEQGMTLGSEDNPPTPRELINLGSSLTIRFNQLGQLSDIDKGVSVYRTGLHLIPDDHPDKPEMLSYLGDSLLCRFERLNTMDDLNECITTKADAIRLTPDRHPGRPSMLSHLGYALASRFTRLGDPKDLTESISKLKDAIHLTPDDPPVKVPILANLAGSLHDCFEQSGDLGVLNEAISRYTEAVHLTPDDNSEKPTFLDSLGICLRSRFSQLGDISDLTESISSTIDAIRLISDGHPGKQRMLGNLSVSLNARFKRLGDITDLDDSISKLKDAVHLDSPQQAILLYNLGSFLRNRFATLGQINDLNDSITNLKEAFGQIGDIDEAISKLQDADNLTPDGHPLKVIMLRDLAISFGQRFTKLQMVSDGQKAFHQWALAAQSPTGPVVRDAARAAIYSGQLEKAVEWLEEGRSIIWGQLLNLRTPVDALKQQDPELAKEFISLSAQLEGAGTHGSDWKSGTLQSVAAIAHQAHDSAHKRDVLIKQIREMEGFERFLLPKTIAELSLAAQRGNVVLLNREEGLGSPEDDFAHILSELWVRLVKPVLAALAITTPAKDNLERIWWCPTASLTFLPIHAAGLYGKDDSFGSKLSDFAISSYTSSLAALQCARGKIPVFPLMEQEATIGRVEEGMMKSGWVHFACHGVQDRASPTESALLLAGSSRLTLSRIIHLSLPQADLAFLSACQTATGNKELPEESVHLAAGMLLAGYRGVIATMWSIMDNDAPKVAADVYEHLFKVSPPDPTRAAEALHLAVKNLREGQGGSSGSKSFFNWVPFIHLGV